MKNLTLVIPAKNEEYSLPKVLNEIKYFKCKKIVVLGKSDFKTITALNNFDCKIIKQENSGYGNAIIEGINKTKTKYVCIFNADGSFHPKYLNLMLKKIDPKDVDLTIFSLVDKSRNVLGEMAFKIENDEVWENCKNGNLDGLSIEGYFNPKPIINMNKQQKDHYGSFIIV